MVGAVVLTGSTRPARAAEAGDEDATAGTRGGTEADSEPKPAHTEAPDGDGSVGWVPLPVIAYAPETSLMLGAASVFTFHLKTPPARADGQRVKRSSLMVVAAATFKAQYLFEVRPNLYFDGDDWQLWGTQEALWFPRTFWGIGNDTPDDAEEDYTEQQFGSQLGLNRRVISSFRAGLETEVHHLRFAQVETGGLIDTDAVPGSDGGWLVGLGPVLLWDGRDTDFSARRGGRYELRSVFFTSALGSDYSFAFLLLDLRQFFPLPYGHVLATQLYGKLVTEGAPFASLTMLGGSLRLRGFYEGRYRDRQLVTGQVEYRLPVFWRFGAAAFVAAGDVAPAMDAFDLREFKLAGGGGLRFEVEPRERVNVRLDGAVTSHGDVGVYLDHEQRGCRGLPRPQRSVLTRGSSSERGDISPWPPCGSGSTARLRRSALRKSRSRYRWLRRRPRSSRARRRRGTRRTRPLRRP
jgi:hypothetical protein